MSTINNFRYVIVASTSGSVIDEVLKNDFFRGLIHSLVADRDCPAVEKARNHSIPVNVFDEPNREQFCNRLIEYLMKNKIDYIFSWYMKTYTPKMRSAFRDKIINFHLALLPAFKGYDGFNEGVNYGVRFVGSTVEIVDKKMDEGKIVLQAVCPLNLNKDINFTRHRIFEHQCKSVLQVAKWIEDKRISIDKRKVSISGTKYTDPQFSPKLDFEDAIRLKIPYIK